MRIVHNGLFLTRPGTGTGEYSTHLLAELAKAMPEDEHLVLTPDRVKNAPSGLTVKTVPLKRRWRGRGLALDEWETRGVATVVDELKADVFHSHYPTPPVPTDVPVLMTVHDVIPWRWPQYRASVRRRLKLRRIKKGISMANHILTVSETSKNEILAVTDRHPADITVTFDGVDDSLFRRVSDKETTAITEKYGLTRPFILYLGGYDYRKNVRRLLQAFARSGMARSHDLVLAGALSAPQTALYRDYADLPGLARKHGIASSVQQIGYVPDDEKPALLSAAEAFVYPSLDEGFGLPIAEALAAGTPVIASAIPSTKELFGSAVTMFDPENTNEFAKVLREQLSRPSSTNRSGVDTARRYTWQTVAEKTARAYRSAI